MVCAGPQVSFGPEADFGWHFALGPPRVVSSGLQPPRSRPAFDFLADMWVINSLAFRPFAGHCRFVLEEPDRPGAANSPFVASPRRS